MREEFTSKLRTALEQAQDEARALNQDFVSTEHLLLALLRTEDSEALACLKLAGVNAEALRRNLIDSLPRGEQSPVVTGNLPLSPKARRAVNTALVKAQTARLSRISSRLLLASLLEELETISQEVIVEVGTDLDNLQRILARDGAVPPEA